MSRNDFGLRFGEPAQYFGNVPDGRTAMKRGGDVMPKRNKKAGGGSVNDVSQSRKMVSSYAQGGIAKGCGGIMKDRRKVTKKF